MTTPIGNRELIRALNRSHVLNTIKTYGPIGRAKIARQTGLSPATITAITADLIAENLVLEKSPGDSSGGRPPILLTINPQGGYVIGIKLTEENAVSAMTDLEANVIAKSTTSLSGHDPEQVVSDLNEIVNRLLHEHRINRNQLLGIGVGLAGIIDAASGVLRQSPIFGWKNVPLGDMLQRQFRVPVYLENDVNTLTLTEKWFGSGQDLENFLIVTIGRGVGMGIVVNGQFYRGQGGGAGELGHTVVDPNGPFCACGKRGCLENYVSDPGLVRLANEAAAAGKLSGMVHDIYELLTKARAGEPGAVEIFARAGTVLGQAVANLINLFNPQKIIISGEGVRAGDFLFGPMNAAIQQNAMPALFEDTRIQTDPWGDDAWARGAASLVLRELFESPVHKQKIPLRN
jgi:predicted NBD/HSP70 family sugar kinase